MPRLLILAFSIALLLVPATADARPDLRLRGTVAAVDPVSHLVTVNAGRQAVVLHVPGSVAAVRIGRRVELRGSTLRAHGNGSRILARGVTIVASRTPAPAPQAPRADEDEPDDDEVEIKGRVTSLSPLTVQSATRSVTCAVPAGTSLAGFAAGDFVEITCDLIGGTWVLRELEHEDDDDEDEDDDRSGSGGGGSGSSGSGGGGSGSSGRGGRG